MIKAIETSYKGYRFRSRLEARWAVFFDALGVEWQYEVEGYDLTDAAKSFVNDYARAQVLNDKDELYSSGDEAARHAWDFSDRKEVMWLVKTLSDKGRLLYLPDFYLPSLKTYVEIKPYLGDNFWGGPEHAPIKLLGGILVHGLPGERNEYGVCTFADISTWFGHCPVCNTFGYGFNAWAERICPDHKKCQHSRKDVLDQTPTFTNAIMASRGMRFEYGGRQGVGHRTPKN